MTHTGNTTYNSYTITLPPLTSRRFSKDNIKAGILTTLRFLDTFPPIEETSSIRGSGISS